MGWSGWLRQNRQSIFFVGLFLGWTLGFAFLLQFETVTVSLVNPFTEGIARAAGLFLNLLGETTTVRGTQLSSPRFAVNIYHGCNGVLATSIYVAAVLAFPATWAQRGIGIGLGIPFIQIINMARIVSLYYIGIYWPKLFAAAHGYVWQSIVILFSMVLWIFWAERFARFADRAPD
jgi:exosortase H (IPTLxxWG-CTERM-specific)